MHNKILNGMGQVFCDCLEDWLSNNIQICVMSLMDDPLKLFCSQLCQPSLHSNNSTL
jgi:hypothetical protein